MVALIDKLWIGFGTGIVISVPLYEGKVNLIFIFI